MGRSCCVPLCKSNYGNSSGISAFTFPKDKVLREKWIRCIHRDNFSVNNKTVVCIKHFDPKFIVREDIFPVENGEPIHIPRKNPKLTPDAYPTIFDNQPSYNNISLPQERKDPEERKQQLLQRDEEAFKRWCEEDKINNFQVFTTEMKKKNVRPFSVIVNDDSVLFLKLQDQDIPSILVSFRVMSDLEVQAYYKNIPLPAEKLKFILGCEGQDGLKCDRWSKFETLVSHLSSYEESNIELSDRVLILVNFLKEALALDCEKEKLKHNKIKFAVEQLELSLLKQLRYSSELLIWAATFYYSFPGAYRMLRNTHVVTLPHPVYLGQFLTKIGPNSTGIGHSQRAFLKEKAKLLQHNDKVVTLMLDEVFVSSKLTYKAGKILGVAENSSELDPATTIQVFMSSSILSDHKDVIALFPVTKLNAETLLNLTIEVLKLMNELAFEVVCMISDNHSTNRRMFELLCGGSLKPFIPDPFNSSRLIYLLFDNVHILKCIRNNWLNRSNQTFTIPNVEETFPVIGNMLSIPDGTATCQYSTAEARFSDLKDVFHSEKNMLLKLAPNLSRKALYPTSVERQNVSLAVNIFDPKNVAALEVLKSEGVDISIGTIQFLKLIGRWWAISNVQHPMKGKYTRNDDSNPITGPDDSKLTFLESLKVYVDIWHMSHAAGKLSNETHLAFTHTLTALVQLCRYIFSHYNWSYVLTAKFQTDSLEGRFGAYRRLSGCTYNVSVEQILESERKLKVLSVLKMQSGKHGEFTLDDFSTELKNVQEKQVQNLDRIELALGDIECETIPPHSQRILICIASYSSMKVIEKLRKYNNCADCVEMLQSEEEMVIQCDADEMSYFRLLNRGGLKCPSPIMVSMCCKIFMLFQVLISSAYEAEFLKLENQRDAVVALGVEALESSVDNLSDVCKCGVPLTKIIKKCVKILANIFINNYTKVSNEKKISKEIAKKLQKQGIKRKTDDRNCGQKQHIRKELKLSSK